MNLLFLHPTNVLDLMLIILGFIGGSGFKYKTEITLFVLCVRLVRWVVQVVPRAKSKIPEDAVG